MIGRSGKKKIAAVWNTSNTPIHTMTPTQIVKGAVVRVFIRNEPAGNAEPQRKAVLMVLEYGDIDNRMIQVKMPENR